MPYRIKTSARVPGSLLGSEFTLRPTTGPHAVTREDALNHCQWLMDYLVGGNLEFVELYEDDVIIRRIERHTIT
jgi:hypothetical protein